MDTLSWMTLLLAVATFVLAGMALWSIMQNNALHKKERRERLLNEIVDWAEESAKSAIYRKSLDEPELWKAITKYKYCVAKGEYVNTITSVAFPTLVVQTENVVTKLREANIATTSFKDSSIGSEEEHTKMRNCEDGVTNAVQGLFKECAKIKTRG